MTLKVAFCSHQAAKYAVEHWHYSHQMPYGKLVRVGAWEDGQFIGAVIFGRGATPRLGAPYGLSQSELCELTRVAFREHKAPVSQVVAKALRMLKQQSPGLRLVVSFADSAYGHHGGIYQAGNWLYTGMLVGAPPLIRVFGKEWHPRSLGTKYGPGGASLPWLREHVDPNATMIHRMDVPPKHRYLYPMDKAMRRRVQHLVKEPPRGRGVRGDTSEPRSEGAGSIPADRSTDAKP